MADNLELRRRAERAKRAERLLEDDLVVEAFDQIESSIMVAWRESDPADEAGRHNAYLMWQMFGDLKEYFRAVATKGKAAERELLARSDMANHSRKEA